MSRWRALFVVASLASAPGCGGALTRSPSSPPGLARNAEAERRYCQARGLATTGTILLGVGVTALVAHGALAAGHSVDLVKGDATGVAYHSVGAGAGLALLTAGAVELVLAETRTREARREARPARCPP